MADFAALGRTDPPGFARCEWGHVVVQHETVFKFTRQRIDFLCIALGAQRCNDQGLGFATCEQGRAMGAGQHTVADLNGAHGTGVATVDAGLACQDLTADDFGLDVEQHAFDLHAVKLDALLLQARHHGSVGFAAGLGARLLAADLVGGFQLALSEGCNLGDQVFIADRGLPGPLGLAGFANQLVDRIDGQLALLVTEHHTTEHDLFAQLLGFRLHHQHRSLGTRHHQIHAG